MEEYLKISDLMITIYIFLDSAKPRFKNRTLNLVRNFLSVKITDPTKIENLYHRFESRCFNSCQLYLISINFRYPEKPQQDIQQSEVYKMVQEADGKGKPSEPRPVKIYTGPEFSPEVSSPSSDVEQPRFLKPKKAGLSFRVLQWMTDTDTLDDETVDEDVDSRQYNGYRYPFPSKPPTPLVYMAAWLFQMFRSLLVYHYFLYLFHTIASMRLSFKLPDQHSFLSNI